jgi:mannose-6-phosphate isomerase-like protein (cupin superfamily)
MPEPHVFDAANTAWSGDSRYNGVFIKILETRASHAAASVVLMLIGVNRAEPLHTHDIETETTFVQAGEGSITLGEEVVKLRPGMGVTIPPGLEHSLRSEGDIPLELIVTHSPPVR